MGIVVYGQFYRGVNGGGGEFGHTVLLPDGPVCDCGKRGCLEALAADFALLREAQLAIANGQLRALTKRTLTIERLIEVAHSGDETACRICHGWTLAGHGIANLVGIFNPLQS
jgi:predicted NBD/HSP70 family sugar kinase